MDEIDQMKICFDFLKEYSDLNRRIFSSQIIDEDKRISVVLSAAMTTMVMLGLQDRDAIMAAMKKIKEDISCETSLN